MKKIITLVACLATLNMHCTDVKNSPVMKKIVIKVETIQEDGQTIATEQVIRAIAITPEQATELKANYETHLVEALKYSPLYNEVFTIEDTTYIAKSEDRGSVSRSVTVTDDIADEDTTVTSEEPAPTNN